MTSDPLYLLDANVFIEAAKGYYAFDIAPRFWEALISEASEGRVRSIDRVKEEIDRGNDELKEWANGSFREWFVSTDADDMIQGYRDVMVWAFHQNQFKPEAKANFATKADAWLVAYVMARECVVLTLEQFDPYVMRKIPIPNVCRALNVQYVDTFLLLRTLGVRLA